MSQDPRRFSYESMGTQWNISIWDEIADEILKEYEAEIKKQSTEFDHAFSRFIKTSLIWKLTEQRGKVKVPKDLVSMLRLYQQLHDLSGGKCNPLIGFALSDLGYDAEYSLETKKDVRPVPDFHAALSIIDDEHIELKESVLIDLGALGKGYFVDKISAFLKEKGIKKYLVDGSGDIYYSGNGTPIRAGLEHPGDAKKAIGVLEMKEGAMCSSAGNRRKWGKYHHTVDPHTLTSPGEIIATWVTADSAALADGLATCLFFCAPEKFAPLKFEYCLLNPSYHVKRSAGFVAELF